MSYTLSRKIGIVGVTYNSAEKPSHQEAENNAPRTRELVLAESQDSQKLELIRFVMESRLSRLQNYKLTTDSSMWNKSEYTDRAKRIEKFLDDIKNKVDIISASNELAPKDKSLIRDELMKNNGSVGDMQKTAIRLMRADNGSDQLEKFAIKDLSTLVESGIQKLNNDTDALTKIKQRTQKHFGEMMTQGAFLYSTDEQVIAAKAGLESMYQMRYIAKEYIDEKGGIAVPPELKHTWENYRDSMDIKDAWFTMSDAGSTQLASFLLYDLAPMIISGGAAGVAGKLAIRTGGNATAMLASRMPAAVKYVNSGSRTANAIKTTTSIGSKVALATAESAVFDTTFEGLRNQRFFTDKPHWQQDLIKNAAGFGFSRYFAGATKFGKMTLDPLSNQLIKQGLVVPAIITGVGVSQKLLTNDPDAYHNAWQEFLLGAIVTGAFHTGGKVWEAKMGSKNTGISKLETTPDGQNVIITVPDGQKFTTRMTDKIKNAFQNLRNKDVPVVSSPQGTEMAHGARLEPIRSSYVVEAPKSRKLPDADSVIIHEPNNGAIRDINGNTYTWNAKSKDWSLSSEVKPTQNGVPLPKSTSETQLPIKSTPSSSSVKPENATKSAPKSVPSPRATVGNSVPQLVSRDNLATSLKVNRYLNGVKGDKGIPNGKIELTTGESITVTPENIKPLQKEYDAALKIEPESARSAKLAELDTQFAERLILDNGRKIEVGSQDNAQKIVNGLGKDPQYSNLQIIHEPNGKFSVSRTPKDSANNPEKSLKAEEGNTSSPPNKQVVVEVPISSKPGEFTFAFANGLSKTYRISINPDGSTHIMVKNFGKFENATEVNGGIPKGQVKESFDERIVRELKNIKTNPSAPTVVASPNSPNRAAKRDTPLRQSRLEAREHLRTERAEFRALGPEVRTTRIDGVKLEGKQLAGRKGDLENKLNSTKKPTPDEITQIKKDIAEIDKKIMANKRQQNMMEKGNKIANEAEAGLIAAGAEPAKIAKDAETPEGRKQLANDLDAIKEKDYKKWLLLAPLILLLLFGMKKCSENGDSGTSTIPPVLDPNKSIGPQIDGACGADSGKNKSSITERDNGSGMKLTDKRRESISSRWMKTNDWKDLVKLFEGKKDTFKKSKFADVFNAMSEKPTIENVQEVQRWIGMEAEDSKTAQDGILGINTTQAISNFISKCTPNSPALNKPAT